MKIEVESRQNGIQLGTLELLHNLHSPLCGLVPRANFVLGGMGASRKITVGAELTGLQTLIAGIPNSRPGAYHIGASGMDLDGVLIRTLAEAIERYAQIGCEFLGSHNIEFATYRDVGSRVGLSVVEASKLVYFRGESFRKSGFPFKPFDPDAKLGWIEMESLLGSRRIWCPAQLVLVGYRTKKTEQEPKFWAAVTTGTAAHRARTSALLNALLELIQIDAAVGHWYSDWPAFEVTFDERIDPLRRLIDGSGGWRLSLPSIKFLYIPSPDLPGFPIACILRGRPGTTPVVAAGLGCSLNLLEAMSKAWLEALGVWDLASINRFELLGEHGGADYSEETPTIYDLDSNVGHYAAGRGLAEFEHRFASKETVRARDLPPDFGSGAAEDVDAAIEFVVSRFSESKNELLRLDLSTPDILSLGFIVERVWSPDLLSLPLPSAPQSCHIRFKAYGGLKHERPHPYP